MEFTIEFLACSPSHAHIAFRANGALAGRLILRPCEARALHMALQYGCPPTIKFSSRGKYVPPMPGTGSHVCSACEGSGFELPEIQEEPNRLSIT